MKNQKTIVPMPYLVSIRYERPIQRDRPRIASASQCAHIIHLIKQDDLLDYKERMWVILLNRGLMVLGVAKISEGSDIATVISNKEILQLAILSHATAIILVHNHPSGRCEPSSADKNITKRLKEALDLFDIQLMDHVIIGSENHFSMADEGTIDFF